MSEPLRARDSQTMWKQRQQMVELQLRRRGIRDPRVLEAMLQVPREDFVPAGERSAAYDDRALPLSAGQTISQPFTVAFMCAALQLDGSERVLEIGTGSGYAAAVLARLAREVDTVERIPTLATHAAETLHRLQIDNVRVHLGDGTCGWPAAAPFDAILVSAGGRTLPPPLAEQLAPNGKIVIPLADDAYGQRMWRFTRHAGAPLVGEDLGRFTFVPLVGHYGWPIVD